MSIREAVERVLRSPSPGDLWRLRGDLLEAGLPPDAEIWQVITEFNRFLDELAASTTSRGYSELASRLDIAAVGGVVLEHVLEREDAADFAQRVLTGLLSEGLMVLATRQHVRAWECELSSAFSCAAWYLYDALWRWTAEQKPDVPPGERRRLLDELFAPLHSGEMAGAHKAALLGVLFQLILLSHLSRALRSSSDPEAVRAADS